MNRSPFNHNFMMLTKTSMHSRGIKTSNIYNTINTICIGVRERRVSFYYFHATFIMLALDTVFQTFEPFFYKIVSHLFAHSGSIVSGAISWF